MFRRRLICFLKWEDQISLKYFEFQGRLLIPSKSSEILTKDYRTSSPIKSKIRMKVGCRRAKKKKKTDKMNIIGNQP